ncbi:MAG: CoA-binding protein [Melioribacteraceae bacterium]|nr:MAG: CoA-binding protein [Melioribacteraceae bacterium]
MGNNKYENICDLLKKSKRIMVVGLSKNPIKTSRNIAEYLKDNGYEVVGVNPTTSTIEGFEVYNSIAEVPGEVDIINVFRRSEDIPEIMGEVMKKSPSALWLQLGISNDEAVQPAIDAGIFTVQNRCIKVEHQRC